MMQKIACKIILMIFCLCSGIPFLVFVFSLCYQNFRLLSENHEEAQSKRKKKYWTSFHHFPFSWKKSKKFCRKSFFVKLFPWIFDVWIIYMHRDVFEHFCFCFFEINSNLVKNKVRLIHRILWDITSNLLIHRIIKSDMDRMK